MSTASVSNTSIRRPVFWGDNEHSSVSRVADDEGTGTIERVAGRVYGWDSGSLVWRRLAADADGKLQVTGGVGGGSATEYTEGATDASITGVAVLWEDAADTLRPVSAAKPLPVGDGGGSLTVDGSVTANAGTDLNTSLLALESGGNLAGAAASLAVLDDWDESDRCKVNPISGQAGVTGNSGPVGAATQRTVPAGVSVFRSIDLDESEEEVKASAGTVFGMWVSNTATSTRFIKFYNATAANVIVGTTAPVITIGVPGNSADDVSGSFTVGGAGVAFDTAVTVAATTGVADADTGAPAANDVIVNVFYA